MQMNRYVRVTKGVNDFGKLVKPEDIEKEIDWSDGKDYYTSIYYYNDEHFKKFKDTNSVSGIKDVKTDKLVFDLDCKDNIQYARVEALELINARLPKFNIKKDDVEIYFSGNKGFTLLIHLPREITPEQAAKIAIGKMGKGLTTLDKTIYNASRILRVPGTKHQESGLHKIPLTYEELNELTPEEIKTKAKDSFIVDDYSPASPTEDFFIVEEPKEVKQLQTNDSEIDFDKKPKRWSNCKWSLAQGNFGSGARDKAMTIVAATCRGFGFTKEMTYDICKGALRRSHEKHGVGGFTKEELWKNVIENVIFRDNWKGGTFTCTSDPWLKDYCESLGEHKCSVPEQEAKVSVSFKDMKNRFMTYASDFEKNKIRFGLELLDKNVTLCTSTLNGLLGQPGAGKTSAALQYLKNTSGRDVPSMFFSLDMGEPIVFAKMIQNETGWSFDKVMEEFKSNKAAAEDVSKAVDNNYKNTAMNFTSGLTVESIRQCIEKQNEINGVGTEVKLVVIDYLECIAGPYSDQTANTGFIANQLKDLANELQVCILLLLQTQKHSTPDVSDPLLTLKGVKGSSLIEQSCSTIITLWREGYNPNYTSDDNYISFAVVKNRFGPLWKEDFAWDGKRGTISHLAVEQFQDLKDLRSKKLQDRLNKIKEDAGWDND